MVELLYLGKEEYTPLNFKESIIINKSLIHGAVKKNVLLENYEGFRRIKHIADIENILIRDEKDNFTGKEFTGLFVRWTLIFDYNSKGLLVKKQITHGNSLVRVWDKWDRAFNYTPIGGYIGINCTLFFM